jgi:hypothetical protein
VPSEKIVNVNCEKIQPFSQLNNNSSNSSNNSSAGRFTEGVVKIEISIDNGILVNNFLNNKNSNE